MDEPIESITISNEEITNQNPIPINDVHIKIEPDPVNSLTKKTNLEVSIPTCKPNQELRAAYLLSRKVQSQSLIPDDLSKESDEKSLDETDSQNTTDDEQPFEDDEQPAADADYRFYSDEHYSSADEESPDSSSGSDSDSDPMDSSPKPTKTRSGKPSKAKKQKTNVSAALNETVKGLMKSNILSSADANGNGSDMQIVPVSEKRNKKKAIAEEIAKLPVGDQAQANKDATALIEDSVKLKGSIINMNWKIRGVKTTLKHHQRDRESSNEEPNGGLLCDEMGLGKTLTVLATIAHEKLPTRSKGPTLIIVPRSLVAQWIKQINMHCVKRISGGILEHYAGSRTGQHDVVKVMQKKVIVITTYEEVCGSHPKLKIPLEIKSPEEREAWRKEEYERRAGPFHKIEWHRIVIDEAHSIKNKDSATSIAVRALKGKFKWAMSGTPLHNGVEELYPYLHFIYTSQRMEYESFSRKFSNGLDNILDTVLHRSTYSTRIVGKPIVTLPGISNRVVEVELCLAERLLYGEIQDLGTAMINGLADTKKKQAKCILVVILMLRMFVSHPLLAQKFLETVLNRRVIQELQVMAQEEEQDVTETPSKIIINLLLTVADKVAPRPRPPGDFNELHDIYRKYLLHIRENEENPQYQEFLRRKCPRCEELVLGHEAYVVTSCQHVYCQGCFDGLPDEDGKTETMARVCSSCNKPIEEAGYSEDLLKKSPKNSSKKRKQGTPKKKGKEIFERKQRPGNSFKKKVLSRDLSDDEWDDPSENESDWVSRVGDRMPSAKITAVRELVANWVKEDENTKIVIFAQFLKTIQLLQFMCEKEGWKYALITGKVAPPSRDEQVEKFGKEKDIKVMISSLRTGGVGLNLTMANKCILVDPWWNKAIQDQAYCRLYRIGQPRAVEYVQIIAKACVDTWMISLQKDKTENICQLLSPDSLKEILGSGDVREQPNGGFSILARKGSKHLHSWTQAVGSGILEGVDSSEED
ncbi:hypothetical protein N7517_010450 [Penicillium concentricum]|uniref:RING-type domain-containing protein n=1 Tax=Penicillium concentricum TaxID=293559 RepID=A0A9W9UV35_9EURO|nr:uncharacterized protein N7517_010450 [Penicillium concentricum]KAJ5355841.1 hypothetical protein N7517_010450 [Penicillium concentricum]